MSMRALLNRKYVSWREVRRSRRTSGFSSFSQFGEDAVVASLIPRQTGIYLDVGAGHPVTFSNTYSFYCQGWSGVLVEPLPANVEHARLVRPRDSVVQALCGLEADREIEFFEYSPYEYSTTEPERVTELSTRGHEPIARYRLPVLSLRSLMETYKLSDVDLLSIDVEGAELSVLQSADWERFRPAIAVIEEWDSPLQSQTEISHFMQERGYEIMAVTGFSSIYRAL